MKIGNTDPDLQECIYEYAMGWGSLQMEEICIENRDKTSLLISYFISSYIFMIDFNVENLFEIEPIQFICYAKSSI